MILVCEVCKGNHEAGSEVCPGFDANQSAICFKGHTCVMSNMYACTVNYKGQDFRSSEHAYQWEKAKCLGRPDVADRIVDAVDGYQAKRISKELVDEAKNEIWRRGLAVAVMKKIAQAKFDSVHEFRQEVLDSRGMFLIEATTDTFWGVGFLSDVAATCRPQYWPGKNVMGRILIELRDAQLGVEEETLPFRLIGRAISARAAHDPLIVDVDV